MADQSGQYELALLKAAIQRLRARVEALERGQPAPPAGDLDPSDPLEHSAVGSPTLPEEQPANAPAKNLDSAPSAQLAGLGVWDRAKPKLSGQAPAAKDSWETVVGERWLTWLGASSLILAVAYFVPWAWQHYQLPGWLRVLLFHLAGLGVLVGAEVFRRKQLPLLAQGVAGLGLFTLYAAAYATHHHYHLGGGLSSTITFIDGGLITAGAIALALRWSSAPVILLGALGGYLTPWICAWGSEEYTATFIYLALLNLALLTCGVLRPWQFLKPIALVATALMFLSWYPPLAASSQAVWRTEWMLVLHATLFLLGSTLPAVAWRHPSVGADLLTAAANSLWLVGATWLFFFRRPEQQIDQLCWGMSALHTALFAWSYRRVTNVDRMPRLHLAMALVFFTLAVPLQLKDSLSYLAYAWALEGCAFTAIAVYFRDRPMAKAGAAVLGLALLRSLLELSAPAESLAGWPIDRRFFVLFFCGVTTMLAGSCYWWGRPLAPARPAPPLDLQAGGILLGLGNVVAMLSLTCQWEHRLVLLLWTLDAALLWGTAFYVGSYPARMVALLVSLILVGGRALQHGLEVGLPYQWLWNDRFATLVLVALLYLVAGWYLRTRVLSQQLQQTDFEQRVPWWLHVLGNGILLLAISAEIHGWFQAGDTRFTQIAISEQVTYSVIWSIHAGILVATGFAMQYRLPRLLGLSGFLLVALKVFLIDLAEAPLILRVFALAALGGMLLLTSFWYQKYRGRIEPERPS